MKSALPGRWWAIFVFLSVAAVVAVAALLWQTVVQPGPSLGACPPACPYSFDQPSTLRPASFETDKTFFLYNLIFWLAVLVFVVVEGVIVYTLFRFRNRPPESAIQMHGNTKLEVAWTAAPAVVLAVIMGFTFQTMSEIRVPVADNVLKVKVIGHQFWWEFRYAEQNIVTASELVVPFGKTVEVAIESVDVEHGFWVPELFGKVDAIPGYTTRLRFTPTQLGKSEYGGQCTQYCGTQHAQMRFSVIVLPEAEFSAWVERQTQAAPTGLSGEAAAGEAAFLDPKNTCIACHTIDGTAAAGQVGPNLTHVGSRRYLAGGILENTPENMARWLRDPQGVKPGNLMRIPKLDETTINAMVAYLSALK